MGFCPFDCEPRREKPFLVPVELGAEVRLPGEESPKLLPVVVPNLLG